MLRKDIKLLTTLMTEICGQPGQRSILTPLYDVGEVSFHLIGTSSLHVKTVN